MPNSGYFIEPFCVSGTKTTVPNTTQPDGSVNYTDGYGIDYQLDLNSNPNALPVERDKMNQVFYDITSALKLYQENTIAPFITTVINGGSPFSYAKYAMVLYGGVAYMSLVGSNTDTPPSSKWIEISFLTRLSANADYYVATTGNDSNAGTVGSPWLTIQHAITYLQQNVNLAGYNVVIHVADGTYSGALSILGPWNGNGSVTIRGNTTTPANAIITTSAASSAVSVQSNTAVSIEGFKITTTGSGQSLIALNNAAALTLSGKMEFGATVAGNIQIVVNTGSTLIVSSDYTISSGGLAHWQVNACATIFCVGRTITLTGTPAYTGQFALATACGTMTVSGDTFTGSATGQRYNAQLNGVINTGGGGASYLPGNSAGATTNGGVYV